MCSYMEPDNVSWTESDWAVTNGWSYLFKRNASIITNSSSPDVGATAVCDNTTSPLWNDTGS